MNDFDYPKITSFVEDIFELNGVTPKLVVDLGCGTGNVTIEMIKRGYELIAIDGSVDMLSVLSDKCVENKFEPVILNYQITDFDLVEQVDAIICLTDTINYITNTKDLIKVFLLVERYLKPGGIFIFDINSYYKFENVFGNNVFYQVDDGISYIWECKFNKKTKICDFDITFFAKEGDMYRKFDEIQREKAYYNDEIKKILSETGFVKIRLFEDLILKRPKEKSERIFFSCRKK